MRENGNSPKQLQKVIISLPKMTDREFYTRIKALLLQTNLFIIAYQGF